MSTAPNSIGIVMPFYGRPDHFQLAVESVRGQTDPAWRLTVIDDRYPDPDVAQWAAELEDPRITVIRNAVNLGVSGNFRRSVELAEDDWTVIMGCDDTMHRGFVARARRLAEGFPHAAYLQPGVDVIDADGDRVLPLGDRVKSWYRPKVTEPTVLEGEALAVSLLRGNWTYFPSIVWRTSWLHHYEFRADLDVVLDLALQLQIVQGGGSLVLDTEPVFSYRRHASSVSSWSANDGTRFEEEGSYFREISDELRRAGWSVAARAASRHFSSRLNAVTKLPGALASRDGRGIRSLLRHAVGGRPAAAAPRTGDRI